MPLVRRSRPGTSVTAMSARPRLWADDSQRFGRARHHHDALLCCMFGLRASWLLSRKGRLRKVYPMGRSIAALWSGAGVALGIS